MLSLQSVSHQLLDVLCHQNHRAVEFCVPPTGPQELSQALVLVIDGLFQLTYIPAAESLVLEKTTGARGASTAPNPIRLSVKTEAEFHESLREIVGRIQDPVSMVV